MRKKTRDETPNAKVYRHPNLVSPMEKLRAYDKLDLSEKGSKDARDYALEALAKLKEREKQMKLHSVRVDSHTILCSNKRENLERRVKSYKT